MLTFSLSCVLPQFRSMQSSELLTLNFSLGTCLPRNGWPPTRTVLVPHVFCDGLQACHDPILLRGVFKGGAIRKLAPSESRLVVGAIGCSTIQNISLVNCWALYMNYGPYPRIASGATYKAVWKDG